MTRLQAIRAVDGAGKESRLWSINGGEPPSFPMELPFADLPDGARIDLRLEVFDDTVSQTPFLTRHVTTSAVAGKTLLLRVRLQWACVPTYHLTGDMLAPVCDEPSTCVAASCVDPYVSPERLEPYSPTWMTDFADECRALDAGPPALTIGEGLDAYAPLSPDQPVKMHLGPQGGFHVWLAVRTQNLHRVGSTTHLVATSVATGEDLCDVRVPDDYTPAAGGRCDLPGIRCVVAYSTPSADGLEGQKVHLVADVVDVTDDVAFAEQDITLTTQ